MTKLDEEFLYSVFSIIEEIPYGCVATYGQIASLMGREKNARMVGKALHYAELYGHFPCHRVVNHTGRLVPHWIEQRSLLEKEGVSFKKNGMVDLKKCRWKE